MNFLRLSKKGVILSLKNRITVIIVAALAFVWPQQVLAGDLVKFNFQTKPTVEDYCASNTVTGSDNLGNAGQASVVTQVGDAECTNFASTPISNFAIALVEAVAKYCGGRITGSNVTCMKDKTSTLPTSYPELVYGEIYQSTMAFGYYNGGYYYQCVGFVSTALAGVSGFTEFTSGGCAAEMAGRGPIVPQGAYRWIPSSESAIIQPGDFPVWTGGCGHVAIVTSVQGNYSFTVAEALGTNGAVQTRTFTKSQVPGWLRAI